MAFPSRKRGPNLGKVKEGRGKIVVELNGIASGFNKRLTKKVSEVSLEYMDCVADVYEGGAAAVSSGRYTNPAHAEMNALSDYLAQRVNCAAISTISISSPPCKSCAFVLDLLGLASKVVTTGAVVKHFTGSWEWPAALKQVNAFDPTRWALLQSYFADSGMTEQEILLEVIDIVQNKKDF